MRAMKTGRIEAICAREKPLPLLCWTPAGTKALFDAQLHGDAYGGRRHAC